jgi:hypothetical protein
MFKVSIPTARDELYRQLHRNGLLPLAEELLLKGSRIAVFAGAVRDIVATHEFGWKASSPRDWDIGVSGVSSPLFEGLLNEIGGIRNRYGGYRVPIRDSSPLEMWRLEETIGLRMRRCRFSLQNVLRSFVLSCNAIAFDVASGYFWDAGALRALETRRIELVERVIMHSPPTFSAKAVLATLRFGFDLSSKVRLLVRSHINRYALEHEAKKSFPGVWLPSLRGPMDGGYRSDDQYWRIPQA